MKLFGHAGLQRGAPAAVVEAPFCSTRGDITVALQGGPVWLDGQRVSAPAEALLEAYERQGREFLRGLRGRFALAILDRSAPFALLALDPMGMESLSFALRGDELVFSSSTLAVARAAGSTHLRRQALFDYLLLHMVPAPETVFRDVFKLRPGTAVEFPNGRPSVTRFWNPSFAPRGTPPRDELERELPVLLHNAVEVCEPDEHTGAFLSGGLDSSTVSGMLGKVTGRPARTFSMGFGVDAFNELEYARIASRHFGTIAHEYTVTPDDVVDGFTRIAAAFDEPFGNSSAVPSYLCARFAAQHGIKHMLAGDGGDELFAGNERYARQRIFEIYRSLPQGMRKWFVDPLVNLIDPNNPVTPLRKLRSYVDQARIPMPERLETWNFMYREDVRTMLEPEFLAAVDIRAPLRTMADVYSASPGHSLLQHMLFYDWHFTLSDNDLRKVGTTCELAGVRVSYPMLDPAVIDLSLRVPAEQMMQGYELRSFYKRAMRGFLPPEILAKKKHGFGLPFGIWLKEHPRLGELIYGLLSDLKQRGIVRADFLDRLIADHREGHPGYYGYAIWDLSMLEAWLQAHPGFTLS